MYFHVNPNEAPRPTRLDLKENNLHLIHGLEYPLPERLVQVIKTNYGKGRIIKKHKSSYHVHYGSNTKKNKSYYCACRTYEQAWYVRRELQNCNWNRDKIPEILDNYSLFYTELMELYQYVNKYAHCDGKYTITIPKKYLNPGQNLELITGYSNLEDALYERDFLEKNEWDYNVLVETINDEDNPYYNMDLPPFPERKIRNLSNRDYHEKELTEAYHLIYDEGITNQEKVVELIGVKNTMTLRNWLNKFWDSTWDEFKRISLTGENPINVLNKVKMIYTPDLSRSMPPNFKGHVQKNNSKRSPYQVRKGNVEYGYYPTEAMAKKVVKKLIECNWDKSKLPAIKKSVGYKPVPKRGNVYPSGKGWCIRRKNKERKMINYGYYKDKRLAELTRDLLKINDWDKNLYPNLREEAEGILAIVDIIPSNMFYGNSNTVMEYNVEVLENEASKKYYYYTGGRYQVYKQIDGKLKSFGCYDTEDEAAEIVEILKLNNWDENVLAILNEI